MNVGVLQCTSGFEEAELRFGKNDNVACILGQRHSGPCRSLAACCFAPTGIVQDLSTNPRETYRALSELDDAMLHAPGVKPTPLYSTSRRTEKCTYSKSILAEPTPPRSARTRYALINRV